jgi:ABC-type multidrug transport system ATPase subunit/pSer/pThr/pTyr-binding forkhead associated (FHA) protein
MANPSLIAIFTIVAGPNAGNKFEIFQQEQIIGRNPSVDIVIAHPEVSSRHARIIYQGEQYFIEDLKSSNGTFVNGQRTQGLVALKDGDAIMLGPNIKLTFDLTKPKVQTVMEVIAEKTRAQPQPLQPEPVQQEPESLKTMLDMDVSALGAIATKPAVPPSLIVTVAGQESQSFPLTKDKITLGRSEDNDIRVPSQIMSRRHATLELTPKGYEIIITSGVTNTLTCQGRPVTERKLLTDGDVLRIDSEIPGMMVSMSYQSPLQAAAKVPFAVQFGEKEKITFGRDATNDVVLDMPNVSRFNTQVTRVGRRYYVTDLRSANGTFVNDKRVEGNVWLNPQDTVRVGPYRFVMGEDAFTRFDDTKGLRVEAYNLNKWVKVSQKKVKEKTKEKKKDLNLLQDISLVFQPREFIVVVGQSGGGKSTLVDAIAGYRPATHGKVQVNDIDVYKNFDAIRNEIGYVPQKDIIHMELTVYQALDFAAQLRMPKDTSKAERHKRVMKVLEDLDLTHRQDVQVSGLSGGQQKRVSIGVELLTSPGLFFLDEPTSGLDPGTETAFMHLMRRLADQGRTIIMVTHATKNVMLADKVVFLARGGYMAWYGPPNEALAYFDKYRSETERRVMPMEFDQIYAILDDPKKGNAKEWAERFQASDAYPKYITTPLQGRAKPTAPAASQPVKKQARKGSRISSWRQFLVLSKRNITILTRDRSAMILMLVAAPAVGALDLVLAPVMGKAPFDPVKGNAANGAITLFLLSLFALLVGGMSQMREFVKESDIYRRERLVNLRILPYVVSKVWVALILAFWHALAYAVLHYIAFKMPGGAAGFFQVYITLVLAVMTGMMLGLFASAIAPNAASAPMTLIMLIVPLIVLSGALAPVPPAVSQIASTRWAFQGLLGIVGVGSDVAADPCWHLDKDLRDAMNLDDKAYQQCKCMGVQMFNKNSCSFPGIGAFYVNAIDQSPPVEPAALPAQPAEPTIPDAPAPPEDKYDQVKMVQYLNALSSYQDEVKAIQENYRNEMTLYQVQAEVYKGEMAKYGEDLARYNITRVSAVKGGEGTIEMVNEKYSWAWVDKSAPTKYYPWLFKAWVSQLEIMVVYFVIILYLIKRKDVK